MANLAKSWAKLEVVASPPPRINMVVTGPTGMGQTRGWALIGVSCNLREVTLPVYPVFLCLIHKHLSTCEVILIG